MKSNRVRSTVQVLEKEYVIRFFDADWNCHDDLTQRGSIADMLVSLALWLKSRDGDDNDANLIVFSLYHTITYVSIEEDNHEA